MFNLKPVNRRSHSYSFSWNLDSWFNKRDSYPKHKSKHQTPIIHPNPVKSVLSTFSFHAELFNEKLDIVFVHISNIYVCVHVNPYLIVLHVISLNVATKTEPVGTNPFEDDEEQEEMAEEKQTTINHVSVNKEEIKMLVNRRKPSANPQPLLFLFLFHLLLLRLSLCCVSCISSFSFLSFPQGSGCCVALHGLWMALHTASVCLSFTPNSFTFLQSIKCRDAHGGARFCCGKCLCLTVRSDCCYMYSQV